jgi:hypothetical protein
VAIGSAARRVASLPGPGGPMRKLCARRTQRRRSALRIFGRGRAYTCVGHRPRTTSPPLGSDRWGHYGGRGSGRSIGSRDRWRRRGVGVVDKSSRDGGQPSRVRPPRLRLARSDTRRRGLD